MKASIQFKRSVRDFFFLQNYNSNAFSFIFKTERTKRAKKRSSNGWIAKNMKMPSLSKHKYYYLPQNWRKRHENNRKKQTIYDFEIRLTLHIFPLTLSLSFCRFFVYFGRRCALCMCEFEVFTWYHISGLYRIERYFRRAHMIKNEIGLQVTLLFVSSLFLRSFDNRILLLQKLKTSSQSTD